MQNAIVIPLEFWQNPVEDVILIYSERQCSVYFACWDQDSEPADYIAHLAFMYATDVRSARRECSPYRVLNEPRSPRTPHYSYILEVSNSELVRKYVTFQNLRDPRVPISLTDLHHFVVVGHDIYHEIVAKNFTATTIPNDQVTDAALRSLII